MTLHKLCLFINRIILPSHSYKQTDKHFYISMFLEDKLLKHENSSFHGEYHGRYPQPEAYHLFL